MLQPRELRVLRLMAYGLTNAEIGTQLYITEKTVKNIAMGIFDEFGTTNRTATVLRAMRRHIIPCACGHHHGRIPPRLHRPACSVEPTHTHRRRNL